MGDLCAGAPNVIALNAARGCLEAWLCRPLPRARVGRKMWGIEFDTCLRGAGGWPRNQRSASSTVCPRRSEEGDSKELGSQGQHPEGMGLVLGHKV